MKSMVTKITMKVRVRRISLKIIITRRKRIKWKKNIANSLTPTRAIMALIQLPTTTMALLLQIHKSIKRTARS